MSTVLKRHLAHQHQTTSQNINNMTGDQPPLRIILVRHGQTDHNRQRILQGHLDTDLNETGIKEASLAGQRLQDEKCVIDAVWSSDLKRCRQTTEIILKNAGQSSLEPTYWPDLRERAMGDLENMSVEDARVKAHNEGKTFHDYGESAKAAVHRLNRAFDQAVDHALDSNYKTIMIVSHGGVISKFAVHLLQRGFVFSSKVRDGDIRVPYNTSFTIVLVNKTTRNGVIDVFGDASHLGHNLRKVDQSEQ
uniref:ARAD1D03674p n=1 Tax=Blastobotrys adeninivorans TaxID=409370 RepID=A0A060T8H9_BLAAD